MTEREVLKLALEALKHYEQAGLATLKTIDAFTAIKEALAQPEQIPPSAYSNTHQTEQEPDGYVQKVIDALYENGDPVSVEAAELLERIAKPEQEPVAWRGYNWGHSPDDWVYRDFDDPILDGNGNNVGQPLYTTPPQRTWVGLTDEELRVIENKINPNMRWRSSDEEGITLYPQEYYELVRAIEAAHGIKE